MKEFEKEIILDKDRILKYSISDGFVPFYTIRETILKDGKPYKYFTLNRWDDYCFNGWMEEEYDTKSKLQFVFDANHPLYIPFMHLLCGNSELIIDDDDTPDLYMKYMRIFLKNHKVFLEFINKLKTNNSIFDEKYRVFIKNILYDIRSKLGRDNYVKNRLHLFYEEIDDMFNEEIHQYTTEEYLIQKDGYISLNESKKYVRKLDF